MKKKNICPKCSHIATFDPCANAYYCVECGHMESLPKTALETASSSPNDLVDYLSLIAPFSMCELVCGNDCTAIGNFKSTAEEQCKEKIRKFLNKSVADREVTDG